MLTRQNDRVPKQEAIYSFAAEKIVFADHERTHYEASVATETPVGLVYGGMPYAVMMATPADLEDFVYGFSLTEGIIKSAADIRSIALDHAADTVTANIILSSSQFQAHLAKRRMMSGRTSCGLCGMETVADLPMAHKVDAAADMAVPLDVIHHAVLNLEQHQPLNKRTRSVHAAAWCDLTGGILVVREDVGRHNALDKVIGHLLQNLIKPQDGFLLITSRASFEMVEKTALFGVHTLVAISAPTSLAIRRAAALGVRLLAVARHDSVIQFTQHEMQAGEAPNP